MTVELLLKSVSAGHWRQSFKDYFSWQGNFQVPNPFGQDAGRGAMEGVGEEEWVVTKDKEEGVNIH